MADSKGLREAKEYLRKLGYHGHALCPEHKKPYAVPYKSIHAGTVKVCPVCEKRIARQDALWVQLNK